MSKAYISEQPNIINQQYNYKKLLCIMKKVVMEISKFQECIGGIIRLSSQNNTSIRKNNLHYLDGMLSIAKVRVILIKH